MQREPTYSRFFLFISNYLYYMSSQTKLIKDILSLYDTILEDKEVDETVDSLRNTLDSLGYDEKGSELTSGGSVNDSLTDIVSNILKRYKESNPNVVVTITSGNDKFHQNLNYKSKHTEGNAIDLTISPYNGKNAFDFISILNDTKNRDNRFSYIDEYTHPSGAATGGHFHLQYGGSSESSSEKTTDTSKTTDDSKTKSTTTSTSSYEETKPDPLIMSWAGALTDFLGLKEERIYSSFGDNVQSRYGEIVIPKDNNSRIKSPVSGTIILGTYRRDCNNRIIIKHEINGEIYYLEYCGITNPLVSNNDKIKRGDVLGASDSDVRVSLRNSSKNQISIDDVKDKEPNNIKKKNSSSSENETVLSKLLQLPFKPFQNKYDESGKMIEKRWGSATEKEQPVDWINRMSPTYSKKLEENLKQSLP